ncbi:MAG: 6-carboxytetrahydropterin synthase QueD [Coriobacteriales bacterium]|jgi:queuosine biosynthesis protein QueD|nr:6-carboxytetrahydropterin synthase QueD [Coriobacteriales bacterium]
MRDRAILHTDGGSRGNPGPSGIGFVLLADDGRELVTLSEGGACIGEATNNIAEYRALLWGLENARALGLRQLSIRADSELLVKQIKGQYRVKSEGLKPLFAEARALLGTLESYDIAHVYREENSRADALANMAMDTRASVGNFQVDWKACANEERPNEVQPNKEQPGEDQPGSGLSSAVHDAPSQSARTEETISSHRNEIAMKTGRYFLTVKDHFDAAHALVGYPGECRELHGHTWDIEATVSGTELDEVGIVYDFKALKADLAAILKQYDHVYLNEVPPFDRINATAENLARVIHERLAATLPPSITLEEVAVWESPIAKLSYRRV